MSPRTARVFPFRSARHAPRTRSPPRSPQIPTHSPDCAPHPPPLRRSTNDDTFIYIDEQSFYRKGQTNYKTARGYLTVEAVWRFARVFAADPDKKHAEYMKETIADKFANVSTLDRKDLWAYLVGEKESSAKIDITMPAYVVPETERKAGEVAMTETDAEGTNVLQLHTRNSILQCDKDFSAVLEFFGAKQVDGKKKREREPRVAPLPTNRFGDVKEEQFYREAMGKDMLEMGIDPNMSFLDDNKRQRLPQMSEADRLRGEALLGTKRAGASAQRKESSSKQRKDPVAGQRPIIIVPAGYGSKVMFNMYNAPEFLAKEKLVTWDAMHKAGAKKHSSITLKRKYKREKSKAYPEGHCKYEITDKPPDKKDGKSWARVVAVFVSGKEWQFKDWPFKGAEEGDLVETFNRVRGFYAKYDVDTPAEVIKKWNVRNLIFQKNVRHGDRAQFEAFWDEVDKHLELKRSQLKF